jgi:hypothetical protein
MLTTARVKDLLDGRPPAVISPQPANPETGVREGAAKLREPAFQAQLLGSSQPAQSQRRRSSPACRG